MDFPTKIQLTRKLFNSLGYCGEPKLLGDVSEQYNYRNKTVHTFDERYSIDKNIISKFMNISLESLLFLKEEVAENFLHQHRLLN